MSKIRINAYAYKGLRVIILFFFLAALPDRMLFASGLPADKTADCKTPDISAVTEAGKQVSEDTPTGLDLNDFLAGEINYGACPMGFIEISGPVENGRLSLRSVPADEGVVPSCSPRKDLPEENEETVTIQWPGSPDGSGNRDVTETCSSVSIPLELLNVRDNLLFLPDKSFTGPVTIHFRLGAYTAGGGTEYSTGGSMTLDVVPATARTKGQSPHVSAPQIKDSTLKPREGAIVQVGNSLKSLAGKTASEIKIVELPDTDVGALRFGADEVQSGQTILVSKLKSLYFSPVHNPDFFGDLTLKWLAIGKDGSESNTATLTIRYINVIDLPTTGDSSITISKGTAATLTTGDFPFDSMDNDTFTKLKIASLPNSKTGKLTHGDVWIKSVGKVIDLSSKPLVFSPVQGKIGNASFRFHVGSGSKFSKKTGNFVITIIEDVTITETPDLLSSIRTTTSTTPTWTWTKLDKATSYEVSFDGTTWTNIGDKQSYKPDADLDPGEHTFYLRGLNSLGAGPQTLNAFTILPPFASSTPEFRETIIGTVNPTPSWSWDSMSGAVGYEVSMDGQTWVDRGASLDYTQPDSSPLAVGSYTLYLRAYNVSASRSLVATTDFKIVKDISGNEFKPAFTATVSNTTTTPTWSWNEVPGATSYEVSFDNVIWTDNGAKLYYSPATPLDTGSFTFYLRARNEASTGTHVEDEFIVFKDLTVVSTVADISVTESGNLDLNSRRSGSIDLSNVFSDPDGFAITLKEPVLTCDDEVSIVPTISGKTFNWVSDGIGKCKVTIQATSGPEKNLKTGEISFNVEIKPQAVTLLDMPNECGRTEKESTDTLLIRFAGISNSLLSDSQILRMINLTILPTSEGAVDASSITSNGTWKIACTETLTGCTRLDTIKVQYKIADDTKIDHMKVEMKFGDTTTTKLFDIVGRNNPGNAACL